LVAAAAEARLQARHAARASRVHDVA
jgi:hypothetical protein